MGAPPEPTLPLPTDSASEGSTDTGLRLVVVGKAMALSLSPPLPAAHPQQRQGAPGRPGLRRARAPSSRYGQEWACEPEGGAAGDE